MLVQHNHWCLAPGVVLHAHALHKDLCQEATRHPLMTIITTITRASQDMLYSQPTELPQVAYQSFSQVRKVDTKVLLPTSSAEFIGLCRSTHSWPPKWPAEPLPEAPRPPVTPLLEPGRPLLLATPEVLAPDQQKAGCIPCQK